VLVHIGESSYIHMFSIEGILENHLQFCFIFSIYAPRWMDPNNFDFNTMDAKDDFLWVMINLPVFLVKSTH
jgi:hypothetical protein